MSVTEVCVSPDEDHLDAWRISNEEALERLRTATSSDPDIGEYGRRAQVFGAVLDEQLGTLLVNFSRSTGLGLEAVEPRRAMAPVLHRLLQTLPGEVLLVMWANDGEPELRPLAADPTVQQIAEVLDKLP